MKVSFNEKGYNLALSNYNKYKHSVQSLVLEAGKLSVKVSLKELEESSNVFVLIATKYVDTLDVNLPNLNPIKYLELTNVDTGNLSLASNLYNENKKFKDMPKQDDYSTFLEGEKAIQKHKELSEVSSVLNEWMSKGLIKSAIGLQRAFANAVIIDSNMKFNPSINIR